MQKSILLICTANICRSPMAAALFQRRKPASCGMIRSAGINGIDGLPAHRLAQEMMYMRGIDISDHRARTVTPNLLKTFDLILTMETNHQEWIKTRMPALNGRVHLLGHWRGMEIPDPSSGSRHEFERAAEDIEQCVGDWTRHFAELNATDDLPGDERPPESQGGH